MINSNLYHYAKSTPDRPFLVFDGQEITYGKMGKLVSAFAKSLENHGVRAGDHVAMLCSNRPAYLIAWFALMEVEAVTIPLNVGLIGDGLRYTVEQSAASFLIIESELLQIKSADLVGVARSPKIIPVGEEIEQVVVEDVERLARTSGSWEPASLNSILYTSGTTGRPKGVMIPNSSYIAAGNDMSAALEMSAEDRIMVFLPLFHANPQMYAVASAVTVGASLILLPNFNADNFFDVARQTAATGFTYVGTVLSLLCKRNPEAQTGHSLRWCVGGGAPEDVWQVVEKRFGIPVRELYGMTETGGWVTMNVAGNSYCGSVGAPRAGVSIEIRNPDGNASAPEEKGEIVVQCDRPGVFFTGYWANRDATSETLVNGWLHTGDRGHMNQEGYLLFDGRLKELIRRGGEMISPVEIEQQLLKHPGVQECVVVPEPDEVMGEEIRVVIVSNGRLTAEELDQFLGSRLPRFMRPRYYSFVGDLPKTETNKIRRICAASMKADVVDLRSKGVK